TRDIDTASYIGAPSAITVSFDGASLMQNGGAAAGDSLLGIEALIGSNFGDTIFGSTLQTRVDRINGAGGDDTIIAGSGNDIVEGGAGFDLIDGDNGIGDAFTNGIDRAVWQTGAQNVHFFRDQNGALLVAAPGGEGVDTVVNVEEFQFAGQVFRGNQLIFSNAQLRIGSDGNSPINGGNGADVIFGRGGNDSLSGDGGSDTIEGETGDDQIFGGQGIDVAYGGLGNDFLRGGTEGDDLFGGFGNDTLQGDNGTDFLVGGAGADAHRGGNGIDTASYVGSTVRNVADLEGKNAGTGDAEGDTFISVENLTGGSSIDLLFGDREDNLLNGSTGNDRVIGRAGDDRLIGDAGFDKLYGNAGADIMSGGGNNDRFIYFNTSDSRPGANRDVITDFNEDGQDRIEIGRLDADETRGGNQRFEFIGSDQFTDAGQLRFIQQEGLGRTLILANTDDDMSSEFQIELSGIVDLDAADFIL
ncbi:MAG: calcium-binding protein, partial [Pseudomonadota bacterium]